ncbi:hypothetical protein BKA70DRAFT_1218484 [Coprinopsis sp. MPI-PUGE-AT-0042]|nr:hypothetical protein BKA70DRAFT_1218484 [Coprinopsis sp. MPI-PUGE-AT-0042]
MPKDISANLTPSARPSLPTRRSPRRRGAGGQEPSLSFRQEMPPKLESSNSAGQDVDAETDLPRGVLQARSSSSGCSLSKVEQEELKKQVSALKSALRRTKNRLEEKTEKVLDLKAEIQLLKADLDTMEKESDVKDELLETARKETIQYRNWWLGEVQFMKLLLNKIPEPNKDIELHRGLPDQIEIREPLKRYDCRQSASDHMVSIPTHYGSITRVDTTRTVYALPEAANTGIFASLEHLELLKVPSVMVFKNSQEALMDKGYK